MAVLLRQLAKEYRALLPAWAALTVVFLLSPLSDRHLAVLASPAYVVAATAIGALAFGHEYTTGVLPLLLVQPCRRARVLLLKLTATASLVLGGAWWLRVSEPALHPIVQSYASAAALLSIAVAPWITMATRNVIAGVVFTLAIPGLLLVGGDLIASARFGAAADHALQHDAFRIGVLQWGSLVSAAAGLALTWRTFARLEVVDVRDGSTISPARASLRHHTAIRAVRPRGWVLFRKELHLQHLTLTIAGLYAVGRIAVAVIAEPDVELTSITLMMTTIYGIAIAALAGAMAGAEERHLRTHEWHLLLPMPVWQQWAVKVAVAVGLALTLGLLVPWLLWMALPEVARQPVHVGNVALVTASAVGSLYLSTVSSNGLTALLAAIPSPVVTMIFLRAVAEPAGRLAFRLFHGAGALHRPPDAVVRLARSPWVDLAVIALVEVLILWLALTNYRLADRSWRRVALHGAVTAAAVVVIRMALGAFGVQ